MSNFNNDPNKMVLKYYAMHFKLHNLNANKAMSLVSKGDWNSFTINRFLKPILIVH